MTKLNLKAFTITATEYEESYDDIVKQFDDSIFFNIYFHETKELITIYYCSSIDVLEYNLNQMSVEDLKGWSRAENLPTSRERFVETELSKEEMKQQIDQEYQALEFATGNEKQAIAEGLYNTYNFVKYNLDEIYSWTRRDRRQCLESHGIKYQKAVWKKAPMNKQQLIKQLIVYGSEQIRCLGVAPNWV